MLTKKSNVKSILALALLLAAVGCQSNSKPAAGAKPRRTMPTAQERTPPVDPLAKAGGCDSRLQDISGLMLLYAQQNHHLPKSLDELRGYPGAADVGDFVCPVSGKPYIYNPDGIPTPSGAGRIMVYDPTPAHDGMRLCLVIPDSGKSSAVIMQVIALPEAFFRGK
jgi:hypothetical protein